MHWEYKEITLKKPNLMGAWEKELNKLGKDGWEIVAVVPEHAQLGLAGSTLTFKVFLKREMK